MKIGFVVKDIEGLLQTGRHAEAESCCRFFLRKLRDAIGDDDLQVGYAHEDLAFVLYHMNRYRDTVDETKEALRIIQRNVGKESIDYVRNLTNLARQYLYLDQEETAEFILQESLVLSEQLPSDTQFELPPILLNLTLIRIRRREFEAARELLQRVSRIYVQAAEWRSPRFATLLSYYSRLYYRMGNVVAAERAMLKSIRMNRAVSNNHNEEFAASLAHLGHIQATLGKPSAARDAYWESMSILNEVLYPDHPLYLRVQRAIASTEPTDDR